MEVTDEGHVRALNTACLTLVGADNLRQVLGTSYLGLVVAADRERVGDFIRRVSAGARGSIEYGIARMSGGVKTVISDAAPLDRGDGGGVATLFVTRDLTDQKAREKRAFECHSQERERLQAEIEAAGDRERTTNVCGWRRL
jgi:PAS domain S-box-containing protein